MARRKPARVHLQWRVPQPLQAQAKLTAMVGLAASPLVLLGSVLPLQLVLPALCLIAIAAAGGVSLFAWRNDIAERSQHVTAWDVAGALAFIGFSAGTLSNPEQLIRLVAAP